MAGLDEYAVTWGKFAGGENAFTAVAFQAGSRNRQHPAECVATVATAASGAALHVAAKQQKEGEHGHRVKVDLADVKQHCVATGKISAAHRQ